MDTSSLNLAKNFEITTSLRYDRLLAQSLLQVSSVGRGPVFSQLYMLPRHEDRMLAAAKTFSWPELSQKQILSLEEHIRTHLESTYGNRELTSPLKVRVTLSSAGTLNVISTSIALIPLTCLFPKSLSNIILPSDMRASPTFRVFLSTSPITPSPFTRHKTTHRTQYNDARSGIMHLTKHPEGIADLPVEILLINELGEIMEGSITTPYFSRGEQWVTPAAKCGGNLGTTRQYALDNALCKEGIIMGENVSKGERVILSNGVRGFGWGIVDKPDHLKMFDDA